MAKKILIMKWIGLHLYYMGDRVKLIKNCIIPLLNELMHEEYISTYFFILYDEKGPHIRLRLKPKYDYDYEKIIEFSSYRCEQYFSQYPSSDPNRFSEFYPNNSVQLISYEPEYARYGGIHGIEIAEKQFRYSSDAVLSYIRNKESNKYNSALNVSIKLHLASSFEYCEKNIGKVILYFNFIFKCFTSYNTFSLIKSDHNVEFIYRNIFNNQKNILIPYVNSIWNGLVEDEEIDKNVDIGVWRKNENKIYNLLCNEYKNNNLELPTIFENYPLWYITQSYYHMTNNRLAISVIDEPLIAYIIMQSLICINS